MRKTILFAAFLLAFSFLATAQSIDTIPTPAIVNDSLSQNKDWTIRSPLSEEELQKREDNHARVARMKQRFRDFHSAEEKEQEQAEQEAAESDFLWLDAQEGGQQSQSETVVEDNAKTTEDESLRLEISRSLQYGKSANTSPPAPVRPSMPEQSYPAPEAYDNASSNRINTNTEEIQRDIKSAFQTTVTKAIPSTESEVNWQAEIGATNSPEFKEELTYENLSAGQPYLLDIGFEDRQYTINTNRLTALNSWANWLKQHPDMRVEVRAYTHDDMDQLDAIDLSIQRAKRVADYWLAQGVLEEQLAYRGYGSLSPLVPNTDPAAKQKNERIEVIILELPTR